MQTAGVHYQRQKIISSCCNFISKRQSKLSKLLSRGFERSVYWNEYKTKSETKNTTSEYRYSLKSNYVGFNRLFVLIYLNKSNDMKQSKTRRYYLATEIIVNYNVIINGENFYDQVIHSDIKRYEESRKSTTGQDEDYNTGCLLDYGYIENHRSIAVDLSRQINYMQIQEQFNK